MIVIAEPGPGTNVRERPRRALKPLSRLRPWLPALVAVLAVAFAGVVVLRLAIGTTTPPPPHPTATTTATPDPLAWYRSLPTPSCPTDPVLLRDFYRQGQCPQGARK